MRNLGNQHLYGTTRWRKMRKRQLKAEPLCAYCLRSGVSKSATVADHIKPHRGDSKLFFDPSNLQSLCACCHNSAKQAEEIHGYHSMVDADGYPIDERHPWNRR